MTTSLTRVTSPTLTLAHFDRARLALEQASTIDEVRGIHDQAEALRTYARQSRQSREMQNRCAEITLRAERRAGELLVALPKHLGGRPAMRPLSGLSRRHTPARRKAWRSAPQPCSPTAPWP